MREFRWLGSVMLLVATSGLSQEPESAAPDLALLEFLGGIDAEPKLAACRIRSVQYKAALHFAK